MSWQPYVDDNLVGTGNLKHAALISATNGAVWAISENFVLSKGEGFSLVEKFKNPDAACRTGITVGGSSYIVLRGDEKSIYGKKGATGVILAKTAQCIIIGYYDNTIVPGRAVVTVESLADYLREKNF
eukprot:TRINITY_DN466_c0_g1_i1.p1 TRINITY_DN466_c0_g1~~TRINITY_DN466_c0_g1_i1.p1  ORF type:complete len:128 (-),score=14.53 TRINITY_DN466_c0_g1_i1:155-538(-)